MNPKNGINILKDGVLVSNTVREGKLFLLKTVTHHALKATIAGSIGEIAQKDRSSWGRGRSKIGRNVRGNETDKG